MVGDPTSFGVELRRARIAGQMSLADLARRTYYSKGHLSKIETGQKAPSIGLARLCDTALGASGRLAALLPRQSADTGDVSGRTDDHNDPEREAWTMTLMPDGSVRFASMSRRHALAAGAASLIGLGLPAAGLSAAARQEATLQGFRAMFEQFRRLGQTASSSMVLPGLIAQTHALRSLSAAASTAVRADVLLVASQYAEYTGWMAQEAGDDKAALWWTAQASNMAAAGGDSQMEVYALVRRALVAFYRDDAAQTIELARQAQSERRVARRIRGLAAQREAQGHALAGNYDECRRALDRAALLLTRGVDDSAPTSSLGSQAVTDPVATATGWCFYDLGRPAAAAEILHRETARIPRHACRARMRYKARLALAYASTGEVDRACEIAGGIVDDARVINSATIRLDLARLARTLTRWHAHDPVRQLAPRLSHALGPISP